MNKKILMMGWEYPPRITGGLGVATKGLMTALSRLGNTVDILLPRLTGDEEELPGVRLLDFKKNKNLLSPNDLLNLAKRYYRLFQHFYPVSTYGAQGDHPLEYANKVDKAIRGFLHPASFNLDSLDHLLTGSYSNRIYQEINLFAEWAVLVSTKLEYDLIHAHDWMTYKAAIGAHRLSGKPLICHIHSTEFDRSGEQVNQYVYDLEREAYHTATMNITVSEFTRRILLERYGVSPEKVRTVHNGVDYDVNALEKFTQRKKKRKVAPNGKIVTFVGRITFQKGPDYFVRAAKKVIENIPGVRFVMAGTGDMYYRMIEMAASMGMGSYFHYTGFLDKNGVSKLYGLSDLYVMPSVSEPFGITPLEAMLHKVPVIISKQSGVSEVVSNAIKVDFWDVDKIANGIIGVLKDQKMYKKLCTNGFKEAGSIGWGNAATKVNHLYEDILQKYALHC